MSRTGGWWEPPHYIWPLKCHPCQLSSGYSREFSVPIYQMDEKSCYTWSIYLIPKVLSEFYQRLQIPTNFCLVLQGYLFMTLNLIRSHYISYNGSEIYIASRFADGPWCCCCQFIYMFEMWSAWYYQQTCMVKTIFPCLLLLGLVIRMGSEALCCRPKYIQSTCIWFLILKTEG